MRSRQEKIKQRKKLLKASSKKTKQGKNLPKARKQYF